MQTVQDFAKCKNISKAIVDTWIYRHGLPVIKIGKRVYIQNVDYDSWVNDHKVVASKEQPVKQLQVVLPKQCRKSSIANKIRKIY